MLLSRTARRFTEVSAKKFLTEHSREFKQRYHKELDKILKPVAPLPGEEKKGNILVKNLNFLQEKLKVRPDGIEYLKFLTPKTFVAKNKGMSFKDFAQFYSQRFGFTDEQIGGILVADPTIVDLKESSYDVREEGLKSQLGWTPEQCRQVLAACPDAFLTHPIKLYNINRLFENLFERPAKEITELLVRHPIIYLQDPEEIKKTLFMVYKCRLSVADVYKIIQENPLVVFNEAKWIELCSKALESVYHRVAPPETHKERKAPYYRQQELLLRNPYILCLHLAAGVARPLRLMRAWGFTLESIGDIYSKYPFLATKSIESYRKKYRFLFRNFAWDLHKNPVGVKIFNYNFEEFIEPRGKIMLEKGASDWKAVLDMNNATFADTFGVPKERLTVDRVVYGPYGLGTREAIAPQIRQLRRASPQYKASLFKEYKLL